MTAQIRLQDGHVEIVLWGDTDLEQDIINLFGDEDRAVTMGPCWVHRYNAEGKEERKRHGVHISSGKVSPCPKAARYFHHPNELEVLVERHALLSVLDENDRLRREAGEVFSEKEKMSKEAKRLAKKAGLKELAKR